MKLLVLLVREQCQGFAELNARISVAVERAGRAPGQVARSACVLVELDAEAVEPGDDVPLARLRDVAAHLRGLAEAGADEAILILRPITEESIRTLGSLL